MTLHAINTKNLPELDDALAEKIEPGSTADQLVQKVRERLENLAEVQFQNAKRQAAVRYLLEKVDCELPAPVVEKEMTGILHDIVRENQVRGISDDEIRKHQGELIGAAQQGAEGAGARQLPPSARRREGEAGSFRAGRFAARDRNGCAL